MTLSHDMNPFPSNQIWERLDPAATFAGPWEQFRHKEQAEFLHALVEKAGDELELSALGLSDEGQALHALRTGKPGKRRVFVWARQHGDESDCTAGLMMALEEIFSHRNEPHNARILAELDLLIIPMVNPDGVARFTRRSAHGIDLNRDAIAAATPEGRVLLDAKDDFKPEVCFNLHDMGARKSDGRGNLVAMAFQACPFGPDEADNKDRMKAKRLTGFMAEEVRGRGVEGVARYTTGYMSRAFGDNMARWNTACVLLEAGGWYEDKGGDDFVRRLFALCLLRGLYAVATGEDLKGGVEEYDRIPFDSGKPFVDRILERGTVVNGAGRPPFRADLAINRDIQVGAVGEPLRYDATFVNIGDLAEELAKYRTPLPNRLILPGLIAVSAGQQFDSDFPDTCQAAPFLRAGITTLVCGVGPFASNRARAEWLDAARQNAPPLNVVAFERVSSLRELRCRHGLSELAGLLVQDLEISAADIVRLHHLFHPAYPVSLNADEEARTLAADIFFQLGPDPESVRMHLHLSSDTNQKGLSMVRSDELRCLVDEFFTSPNQITFGADANEADISWLPVMLSLGGLSKGRVPLPSFLGGVLRRAGAVDFQTALPALNMLTLATAQAFRLSHTGTIDMGRRADVAVFRDPLIPDPGATNSIAPDFVMVNGIIAIEGGHIRDEETGAAWHFSPRLTGR